MTEFVCRESRLATVDDMRAVQIIEMKPSSRVFRPLFVECVGCGQACGWVDNPAPAPSHCQECISPEMLTQRTGDEAVH